MQLHEKGRQFPGTYVELGAFSGMHESNTRFFDECLGWEGLLIEGNPLKYIEFIANRPFAHKMSMAPSCKKDGSSIQFHVSPFTNAGLEGKALAYANETTIDVPCGDSLLFWLAFLEEKSLLISCPWTWRERKTSSWMRWNFLRFLGLISS
jgi:hypothetical protein